MSRLIVFVVVAVSFAVISWSSPGNFGAESRCVNSECMVSAGSSPLALLVALVLLALFLFYPRHRQQITSQSIVGVFRRFGAFFLDFAAIMLVASPVAAIPTLVAEYFYTGSFQWNFEREFGRPTDVLLIIPAVLGVFTALYLYFSLHPKHQRQTLGQYVFGLLVVATSDSLHASFGKRVLLSFIGLCAWPVSVVMALRNQDKAFWWDAATNTRVVRVGS